MRTITGGALTAGAILVGAFGLTPAALAGPDDHELVIDGQPITTYVQKEEGPLGEIYSGWRFRSQETQALEADDFENCAMAWSTATMAGFSKSSASSAWVS